MIYRNKWLISFSRHVFIQATRRCITSDMMYATVKNGKTEEFGKNYIRFVSEYKQGILVCVGEKKELNRIYIFTVEWRYK